MLSKPIKFYSLNWSKILIGQKYFVQKNRQKKNLVKRILGQENKIWVKINFDQIIFEKKKWLK